MSIVDDIQAEANRWGMASEKPVAVILGPSAAVALAEGLRPRWSDWPEWLGPESAADVAHRRRRDRDREWEEWRKSLLDGSGHARLATAFGILRCYADADYPSSEFMLSEHDLRSCLWCDLPRGHAPAEVQP